ncbi:MAG: DsrE family protein [Paracoccaceae bacterium]
MSKLVIVSTWGMDNLERATIPWVVASAGVASDQEVMMFLQASAVELVVKGAAESVQTDPFPAVSDLIEAVIEGGGSINCCGPCLVKRGLKEGDLIDGAHVVGAAYLIEQMEGAKVLSY